MNKQKNSYGLLRDPDPNFDRVEKALTLKVPDRVPIAEMSVAKSIKEEFLGKPILSVADDVEFWHKAGYDYAWIQAAYGIGDLFPGAYEAGTGHRTAPIKNMNDFEKFPWKNPRDMDYSILDEGVQNLPNGMKIISGEGGFFSFSWMLMGMENFCMQALEETDLVKQILKTVGDTLLEINRKVASVPDVGALWIGDDIAFGTSLFMAPSWLRTYIIPYYIEIGKICKEHGKLFIFHSDGNIEEVIDDLIQAGVNALHPIEPQAMDISKIKKLYGNKIALIGNIDLTHTLPHGTEDDIKAEVEKKIKTVGRGGGYCVSSSNSIPYNIPVENYVAMINAVYEYGTYPI